MRSCLSCYHFPVCEVHLIVKELARQENYDKEKIVEYYNNRPNYCYYYEVKEYAIREHEDRGV